MLAVILGLAVPVLSGEAADAGLLRFPAIHGNRVVFGYAGDLYTVPTTGGVARRLTSHVGYEMFPRFSPDGQWIAFTGQYDGNTEVYLMPSEGGEPRRLTYTATLSRDEVSDRMGPNNIVMTWRDNETVVFRSRQFEWNAFKGHLFQVGIESGVTEMLPLPRGGWCSFSPDGKQMVYNRIFREFRTWKRYRGGQADELWLHDFESGETKQLTDNPAQDNFPMWHGDKVYFVSERDSTRQANLFVHDMKSGEVRQVTQFRQYAVKFPSLGDESIVFENGGQIYKMELANERVSKISVEIREDLAVGRDGWRDVSSDTTSYDISPDGNRAVFGARGDVFTVPAQHGPTRNLTTSPGVHERNAVWSPDGLWVGYVSDASGEDEIWIRAQDGTEEAVQLTSGGDTYKYEISWSPDSKRLAWTDKKNRLQFVDVASKQVTLAARSDAWEIRDFAWSPDSRWLAYVLPRERKFPVIELYSLESQERVVATDGWFDVGNPEFSQDGRYLFFVSSRDFKPTYGSTEWNHVYNDMDRIYLVTLAKDTPSPFVPKSDEVKIAKSTPEKKSGEGSEKVPGDDEKSKEEKSDTKADADGEADADAGPGADKKKVQVRVEADGLVGRIAALPVEASGYRGLRSVGDKLYYGRKGKLHFYDLVKEKETEVGDVRGYVVSADNKKMLVRTGDKFAIVDLPSGRLETKDKTIDLSDLRVALDRQAEWRQIFNESWRQMRDFFYAPNMHNVDWPAMRERYEPLLQHVRHRADLTYVIGEMVGELSAGHAYVGGGDHPKAERIPMGLLGGVIERDPSGYPKIQRILPGHNWDARYRSPLTEIGVDVRAGDYILAINGKSTREMRDYRQALVGTAGKQVRLLVHGEPAVEGAREVTVVPTADEQPLYYLDWVLGNIEKVEKATEGRVGYVHVPDMGVPGLNEFAKFYYAQLHKDALIVDVRGNGGGNVSPMIIERLQREPVFWTVARNGAVEVNPGGQVLGPKVLLIDPFSASDGDIVAYRFRKYGLGQVIGRRSWGGVVGIRGSLPLLDGGFLNRPEFSRFDLEAREWVMEGVGVEPDIDVDNDPTREFSGVDDQLNRGIAEILERLKEGAVRIPTVPPYPDKRR